MQLALISDTHVPGQAEEIPEAFRDRIAAADRVIHAGDFATADALADVRSLATELTAVYGNADPKDIDLPAVAAAKVGGATFVVTHGVTNAVERSVHRSEGVVMTREDWLNAIADTARVRARAWSTDDPVVGVGGHTHQVEDVVHEGIRVLNPGSATAAGPAERATMMTADVEDGDVEVTLHET